MKNKALIGVSTFFITIIVMILCFNLFDSKTKKDFSFERKFSKDNILTFKKRFKKMNTDVCIMSVNSDNYIVEKDEKSLNESNKLDKFYFADFNFNSVFCDSLILPIESNVLFSNKEKTIYSNCFKLYENDKSKKNNIQIHFNNLKINSLKPLLNSKTKFLCFAEYFDKDEYKTGFYIIDFFTKEVKLSKLLVENKNSAFLENSLKYYGKYAYFKNEKYITYCCDKFSSIYFFDEKGIFLNELKTSDQTTLPDLIKNNQGYISYKRGSTWSTNMGLYLKDNKAFIFSTCNKSFDNIIIDEYDLKNFNYIQSFKLNYENKNDSNIRNIYMNNNIIIEFEQYYASFNFSKYI